MFWDKFVKVWTNFKNFIKNFEVFNKILINIWKHLTKIWIFFYYRFLLLTEASVVPHFFFANFSGLGGTFPLIPPQLATPLFYWYCFIWIFNNHANYDFIDLTFFHFLLWDILVLVPQEALKIVKRLRAVVLWQSSYEYYQYKELHEFGMLGGIVPPGRYWDSNFKSQMEKFA